MMRAMDATRMLLIRHGETDWNRAHRVQGHVDIPLNAHGHAQARKLAAALAERDAIDHIYSSDLARAWATAQAVSQATGTAVTAEPALRERHFGRFQGQSFAEVCQRDPDMAWHWRHRTPGWTPPGGGESLLAFRQRVTTVIGQLGAAHTGRQIAVVAHGGVLDILYRAATGLDLQAARSWTIGNATINRVLWTATSGLQLVGWDDAMHLDAAVLDENSA